MGRHVDPDDDSFRRSLLRAVAGGAVALALTAGAVAMLTVVGRQEVAHRAVVLAGPVAEATTGAQRRASAVKRPASEPPASPRTASRRGGPRAAPARDVTVQVLSAGGTRDQTLAAARVLADLGYDVVAINPSGRDLRATRTLATRGARAEGEALVASDERFGGVAQNRDFNPDVDLHVLVGADFGG